MIGLQCEKMLRWNASLGACRRLSPLFRGAKGRTTGSPLRMGKKGRTIGSPLRIGTIIVFTLLLLQLSIATVQAGDVPIDTTLIDTATYICINYGDSLLCASADSTDSTIFHADIMMSWTNNGGAVSRDIGFFYRKENGDTVRMAKVGLIQYIPAASAVNDSDKAGK